MENLYRYTGIVIIWAAILLAAGIVLLLLSALVYRLYRRSWLWGAWEILRTCYYYKWTKKKRTNDEGLRLVQEQLDDGREWPNEPYRKWWQRFINEQRELLKTK